MCAGRLHTRILTVVLEEVGLWVTSEFPLKMSRHYRAREVLLSKTGGVGTRLPAYRERKRLEKGKKTDGSPRNLERRRGRDETREEGCRLSL